MSKANPLTYLKPVIDELEKQWPGNRTVNVVCHGHSVPSGYATTPVVRTLDAYPHLLQETLANRFPFAVTNVIVSAIGGEGSPDGAARFEAEALNHRPDVVSIDYALNDRRRSGRAEIAWRAMIEAALAKEVKVILLTPNYDTSYYERGHSDDWDELVRLTGMVRTLADEYAVGLCDTFALYEAAVHEDDDLVNLLSHINHPSRAGHEMIAAELAKFFPAR